jgi:hypothetical protein
VSGDRPGRDWWQDTGELSALLRWLHKHDEHGPLEVDNCIEIVEKPWHWSEEYAEMCAEADPAAAKTDDELARGEDEADAEEQR